MDRKAERIELHTEVGLRKSGYHPNNVTLLDVSNLGCRVELHEHLTPGEAVWLRLPGLEPIEGKVAWSHDWQAGLEFTQPLHPAVFDMMVARLKR